MTVAAVYVTDDPRIITQYRKNLARQEQNTADVLDFYQKHQIPETAQIYGTRFYDGRSSFQGVTWTIEDGDPPEHWRLIDTDRVRRVEPNRRFKEGKVIDREMRSLARPSAKYRIGMPIEVASTTDPETGLSQMYWFGLAHVDGKLWVSWGIDPDESRRPDEFRAQIDSGWRRMPLTEYYLLVEDGKDPFA